MALLAQLRQSDHNKLEISLFKIQLTGWLSKLSTLVSLLQRCDNKRDQESHSKMENSFAIVTLNYLLFYLL